MRFLKTLSLNRRAIYDDRVALDVKNNFTVANSTIMTLPKSDDSSAYAFLVTPFEGLLRYNTDSNEIEVYQGANAQWRALSYKESTGIIQQDLGLGDDIEVAFGPLTPKPPLYVDENAVWAANGNVLTPGNTWTGANLIVLVENVFQLYDTNYDVVEGSTISKTAGEYYIQFSSPVPTGKPVTVLHGFDR